MWINNKWHAEILLHRKNRKPWLFVWDEELNGLVHKTRYGTVYKIFFDYTGRFVEVWIGRRFPTIGWCTYEAAIRADYFKTIKGIFKFTYAPYRRVR